jgi:hypothetical protein
MPTVVLADGNRGSVILRHSGAGGTTAGRTRGTDRKADRPARCRFSRARQAAEEELLSIGVDALPALQSAQQSDNIEIRLRAAEVAGQINERRIADAEIHVIGVYESGAADGRVVVRIESAARPVVLVVCARETVEWLVQPAKGIELVKIIASGHHPQSVLGTTARVQSLSTEGDVPPEVRRQAFYTYRDSGLLYDVMRDRVKELTGKEPTSFQGRYDSEGKPFVIGAAK